MIISLIFLLALTSISSKETLSSTKVQYDVMTPFDKQNNQFNFENTEDNNYLFISVETKNILDYQITCSSQSTIEGNIVGSVNAYFIINALYQGSCDIKFIQDSKVLDMTGTFSVHPLKNEIPIDFKKQKTYSIDYLVKCDDGKCPLLTYSISNPTENYDIYLSYDENTQVIIDEKKFTLSNPFKVCQENDCKENIKIYSVEKGKNYKIILKFETLRAERRTVYAFPGFRISDSPDSQNSSFTIKLSIISLILFLLF